MKYFLLLTFFFISLNAQENDLFHEPSIAYDYPSSPEAPHTAPIPISAYYDDGYWFKAGNSEIGIGGDIQFDARTFLRHSTTDSNFKIRRARIVFEGTWNDWAGFMIVPIFRTSIDNSSSSAHLQFAFIETLTPDFARFRAGLFREPFSLESLIPDLIYEFNERSLGVINFVHGDDIGVMFYGTTWQKRIEYGLGVFNGNGTHLETNSKKEYARRLVFAPFLKTNYWFSQTYFGASVSSSHQHENLTGKNFYTGGGTNFWKWTEVHGARVDWDDDRNRWGCDVEWFYGPFVLRSEYLYVDWGTVRSGSRHAHFQMHSAYVEGIFVLTGEEKGRNRWVIPKHDFPEGWGAWEVAVRIESLSLDRNSLRKKIAIGTSQVWGFVACLNVYLNPFMALKLDWEHYEFREKVRFDKHKIGGESVIITRLQGVF